MASTRGSYTQSFHGCSRLKDILLLQLVGSRINWRHFFSVIGRYGGSTASESAVLRPSFFEPGGGRVKSAGYAHKSRSLRKSNEVYGTGPVSMVRILDRKDTLRV